MPGDFLDTDLPGMLRTDEFGSAVLVTSGDRAGERLTGILEEPPADVFSVEVRTPVLHTRGDMLLQDGDELVIGLRRFRVKLAEQEDGVTRYPLTELR